MEPDDVPYESKDEEEIQKRYVTNRSSYGICYSFHRFFTVIVDCGFCVCLFILFLKYGLILEIWIKTLVISTAIMSFVYL